MDWTQTARRNWTQRTTQLFWWAVGVALVVVVAFVLNAVIGGLVFGVFLYYATRPIYGWLVSDLSGVQSQHSDDEFLDDSEIAAAATLLLVGLPMIAVVAFALYRVIHDVSAFLQANQLTQYRSLLEPYVTVITAISRGNLTQFQPGRGGPLGPINMRVVRSNLDLVFRYANRIFAVLIDVFVMLLVAYYLLEYDDEIARWGRQTFEEEHSIVAFLEGVDDDLERLYWGNLIVVGVTAAIAAVTYYGLQFVSPPSISVPYVFLSAMLTGIFTLIPVVGIKLFYVPMTAYLLFRAVTVRPAPLWFPAAFFVVTLVVVDTIPDFFIRSWISSGTLNMGLVLMSYVFGSIAFGWYGIFLGPIILVLFVHFTREILPELVRNVPVESAEG